MDKFKVKNLADITYHLIELVTVYLLTADTKTAGLLQVPVTDDITLYESADTNDKTAIRMRIWSNMLSLHIVNSIGTWIIDAHYDADRPDELAYAVWVDVKRGLDLLKESPKPMCRPYVSDLLHDLHMQTTEYQVVAAVVYAEIYAHDCKPDVTSVAYIMDRTNLKQHKVRATIGHLIKCRILEKRHIGWHDGTHVKCVTGFHTTEKTFDDPQIHDLAYIWMKQKELQNLL